MLSLHSGLSCPYLSNPKSSQNPPIFRQSNGAQNADLPQKKTEKENPSIEYCKKQFIKK